MGQGSGLPKALQYHKGKRLRNGALAYERAAKASLQPGLATYWRERAIVLLQMYQKERLCEDPI